MSQGSPRTSSRAWWKITLGLLVSAFALFVTFRSVRLSDLVNALATARLVWLLPALACFFVMFGLRALRWAVLLGGAPFWKTFHALNIGYMMNSILPLRVGEVGRALVVSDQTGIGVARALSSVVVERVIDLASVVLLFAAFARLVPMPPAFARAATLGAIAVTVAVVSGALLVWKADGVEAFLRPRLARRGLRLDWGWARFREVCAGFRTVGSGRRLGVVVGLTVAIWTMTIALAYFAMAAFLAPHGAAAGLMVVVSNLGGALPSAPGGLGVVQGFAKVALVAPFHVPDDRAVAFVFVWSLSQQLLLVLLGVVGLGRLGVSLGQAKRKAERGTP
jgi:uncharacterized protein (TIRG00374 family)